MVDQFLHAQYIWCSKVSLLENVMGFMSVADKVCAFIQRNVVGYPALTTKTINAMRGQL